MMMIWVLILMISNTYIYINLRINCVNLKMEFTQSSTKQKDEKKRKYEAIVISGGSTKGILALGAIQYAHDNFLLNDIKAYVGTSVGSMIVYLLAIGYTPIEIMVWLCTNQLLDKMMHFNFVRMVNGSGSSSFSPIHEQLEKMTIAKIGSLLTMESLYERFKTNFIAVTYNTNKNKIEYLSHETSPKIPCLTAIRMSCNLPLVFDKFQYEGSYYIDGGIINNFPIDFVCEKLNLYSLGINLTCMKNEFNHDDNILEYTYKLLNILIAKSVGGNIEKYSDQCHVVNLRFPKHNIFDIQLNSSTKLEMFSDGYQKMKNEF